LLSGAAIAAFHRINDPVGPVHAHRAAHILFRQNAQPPELSHHCEAILCGDKTLQSLNRVIHHHASLASMCAGSSPPFRRAPRAKDASFRNLRQPNRMGHAMFAQVDKPLEQAAGGAASRADGYIHDLDVVFEPQKQPAALERLTAATTNKTVVIRVIPEFYPDFHGVLQSAISPLWPYAQTTRLWRQSQVA